ncbi:hypothetical protein, partial [Flavonifractor sp. An100]|uniref:hypothetical protein n=1 Tax=Flavonifractor sp. An100 TaxID=1965538 RepID=UPI0019D089C3
WCFVFVTLFNLQGTHRSLHIFCAAADFNFITSSSLCQELFSSFFKLFSALSFAVWACDRRPRRRLD